MYLSELQLHDFRNYRELDAAFPPGGALFRGLNGAGKTNLLEAVHMLCIGRSQRHARRNAMIRDGAEASHVTGCFCPDRPGDAGRTVSIGFDRSHHTSTSINGTTTPSLREWFGQGAVVSFGPDDVGLIHAEPAMRRRFLDVLISQIDTEYLDALVHYQQALSNRNTMLVKGNDDKLCELYELQLAEHGAILAAQRAKVIAFCKDIFAESYRAISGGRDVAAIEFKPSFCPENDGVFEWKNVFFDVLQKRRKQDRDLGFSARGPHRDDIAFRLDGRPAKGYASQGQCRSLALSLKLAAVACIETFRCERMLFLVDDAFAELDDSRMAAVYGKIREKGQIFMTTPLEKLPMVTDIAEFSIENGSVRSR